MAESGEGVGEYEYEPIGPLVISQGLRNSRSADALLSAAPENPIPKPEGKTWGRIVVVSPRLPFKVERGASGKIELVPSGGGTVTALMPILEKGGRGKWVGWSGGIDSEADMYSATTEGDSTFELGVVSLTPEEEEKYYLGFYHQVMNPIALGCPDKVNFERAEEFWPIFKSVQKKFAEQIIEDLHSDDIVWMHDFHLTGVGRELRDRGVRQPIGYFLHMPFPSKEIFSVMPHREEIIRDLLACDILGFQTKAFVDNFLDVVRACVPEAEIERVSDTAVLVRFEGRVARIDSFPASIDPAALLEQRNLPDTQQRIKELDQTIRKGGEVKVIFNSGRLEYTKGFYEELLAYDRLLEKHPELIGKLVLCQQVMPSREQTESYGEYKNQILALARKINLKYRPMIDGDFTPGADAETESYADMPVRQMHVHMDKPLYTAYLNIADIHSAPTLADGMNLVAKEAALLGKPDMVQVLGKDAGAAEELGHSAFLIDPRNTEAFADALYEAYRISDEEKRARKSALEKTVTSYDVFQWWSHGYQPMFQQVWDERVAAPT